MGSTDGRGRKGLSLVGQEADVAFYSAHAARAAGPVLVLGCANGRVAAALAVRAGANVLAVDPSDRMIAAAEERRAADPRLLSTLHLVVADLRSLRLSDRFERVMAPQNAVGLMATYEDLVSLLVTAAHHLAPQGSFLFDALCSSEPSGWESSRNDDPQVSNLVEPQRPIFSPHLRERNRKGERRDHRGIHRLRLRHFSTAEVDSALQEAGLVAHERFGDFEGRPFDVKDPLQVIVAGR
jgi:SAM-dependent methyltransferase